MTTPIDTTRLRALLDGTAPGPWYVGSDGDWDWVHDAEDAPVCCMDGGMEDSVYARTREFIAAMDPTTVRALLDEVDGLRAQLDEAYPRALQAAAGVVDHLISEKCDFGEDVDVDDLSALVDSILQLTDEEIDAFDEVVKREHAAAVAKAKSRERHPMGCSCPDCEPESYDASGRPEEGGTP